MTTILALPFIALCFVPILWANWELENQLRARIRADRARATARAAAASAVTQPAWTPEGATTLAPFARRHSSAANDQDAREVAA